MTRTDILNYLIEKFHYETYLEIGVMNRSRNFDYIRCRYKFCVDPNPMAKADFIMTSDEFFNHRSYMMFDIVFVDGLHHSDQVLKDVDNALKVLNPGGAIVLHDCKPASYEAQIVPQPEGQITWNGDVWKAWVKLRGRKSLAMYCIDEDHGCGVIFNGITPKPLKVPASKLKYENLNPGWLNLMTFETFKNQINGN